MAARLRGAPRRRPRLVRGARTARGTGARADQPRSWTRPGRRHGPGAVAGWGGAAVRRPVATPPAVECGAVPSAVAGQGRRVRRRRRPGVAGRVGVRLVLVVGGRRRVADRGAAGGGRSGDARRPGTSPPRTGHRFGPRDTRAPP